MIRLDRFASRLLFSLVLACLVGLGAHHALAGGFGPAQGAGGSGAADGDTLGDLTPDDGAIAVGDGAAWVAESGATARTSLGLGTGDSPTFNKLTLSDGSSGAPSIVGSDADSGIYFNGTDTQIRSNNSAALTLGSILTFGARLSVNGQQMDAWTYQVVVRTSDGSESGHGYVSTNEGAAGPVDRTIRSAAAGYWYEAVVHTNQYLRFTAAAGDTIRDGATVSGAAGYIRSTTVGSTLRIMAINATEWVVVSKTGTWTVDS